ncbi:MAG: hypothetical protein M9944_01310 [Rhizobiaceae bacterium]|nr:hypothetical protein [Rhizobiaceae bacterium]
MSVEDNITDDSRIELAERFELEAAIRAYRKLGYKEDEVIEQMELIFSFRPEEVQALLRS